MSRIPITTNLASLLRDQTGETMIDCKRALVICEGDIRKARIWLRNPSRLLNPRSRTDDLITALTERVKLLEARVQHMEQVINGGGA